MPKRALLKLRVSLVAFLVLLGAGVAIVMLDVAPLWSSPTEKRARYEMISSRYVAPTEQTSPRFELGDDRVAVLEAFALTHPGAPDPPPWRDPVSLAEIAPQQLQDRGALPFLLKARRSLQSPVLSLLFRAEGSLLVPHLDATEARDARTDATVSWDGPDVNREMNANGWTQIAIPLGIWHDTPLQLHLNFVASEQKLLPLEFTEETKVFSIMDPFHAEISERETVRKDGMFAGLSIAMRRAVKSGKKEATYVGQFSKSRESPGFFLRGAESEYTAIWKNQPKMDVRGTLSRADPLMFQFQFGAGQDTNIRSIEAIHQSGISKFVFEIPGLPEMPNPRHIENLFDVWIPKEALSIDPLKTVTRATELFQLPTYNTSHGRWPESRGDMENYQSAYLILSSHSLCQPEHDLTAYEYLETFVLSKNPDVNYVVKRDSHHLEAIERRNWKQSVQDWWNQRVPNWLQW